MPSFLTVRNPFNERDAEGIIENQLGSVEVNAVLGLIDFALFLILSILNCICIYNTVGTDW